MAQHIPDEILYDVRLQERHIRRGLVTREQVDKHREKNVDMAEQADILDLDHLAQKQSPNKR